MSLMIFTFKLQPEKYSQLLELVRNQIPEKELTLILSIVRSNLFSRGLFMVGSKLCFEIVGAFITGRRSSRTDSVALVSLLASLWIYSEYPE